MTKIVVIGTGYVGLPAAIMLARSGYTVVGVDIDKKIVEAINNGVLHIDEKELQELLNLQEVRKNLIGMATPSQADVFMVAVPTPLDDRKKICDLSHVISAVESFLPYLEKGNLVIIESTIPPLTCREIIIPLLEKSGLEVGTDILLCHCPERILPGNVFEEIVHNDRLIGGINRKSSLAAREIYSSFVQGDLYLTDDVTAALCKLMENTYRDVNIALANEFALVAEGLGVDIKEAIFLANKHPRVNILNPGIGVGGHCIPIDPWFIKEVDPKHTNLIMTARRINDEMPEKIASQIRKKVRDLVKPQIVALGAAYKPDTYDIRESPAIKIVNLLREDGYQVELYDPLVKEYAYDSLLDVVEGKDCLVVLVEHKKIVEELESNLELIKSRMRNPLIVRFYL
ncbi:UDP-N-acetyl-D-mannosaminuronic acid dehydrogenase [Candidatus Hakubella thermalkaliphila]|uniref:UDP-N-acetyl-D-mannosaminuronic acid dehydrogenase n=2 Tax=Candidatus Hakubella thermalkaliphila TaxID=2754717 RepID=A0A6V8PV23_9ACTN|nr:nucleotide sugar dehydrogenase [Candidatus Hakubella thermalkaliphila]GFP30073.1 UDP-N-acetyl-D-mannosaminuronic acid dehydrogenase [Candidatus Hakubella thermalkaliphila]GFP36449.1 UDP-N-acetyl-D-mannosaminuronic acid dehydrogenase [Candidatus Hakubella thermalkaliphila]GFP39753.1 UDP-N-acetyl-D-mannosaminuronic acid dehydrogenase [Candidatus Hakubella thermalkaliphila]